MMVVRLKAGDVSRAKGDEVDRVLRVKASGAVPRAASGDIVDAPARGAVRLVVPSRVERDGDGELHVVNDGFEGRLALRRCDGFDLMEARAGRAVLDPAQVATGRRYAAMVERHSKGGIKCASLEAMPGGGGDFMDAYLSEGREIGRMRLGLGYLDLLVPDGRGGAITARSMVDAVCLSGLSVSAVLRRAGWSISGKSRARGFEYLAAALDVMAGAVSAKEAARARKMKKV